MQLLRFADLVQLGIFKNRVTLGRWVQQERFPPGFLLAANTRVWRAEDVQDWIDARAAESGTRDAVAPAPEAAPAA